VWLDLQTGTHAKSRISVPLNFVCGTVRCSFRYKKASRLHMRKINLKNFHVATSVTARDINRRIILNVIRTRQPVSRADVARLTGLQRSTVSLIVDQLIAEGWVSEGAFGRLPRGRRPIFLQLNAERARIIGVNVRPTATTIALADLNGQFLDQHLFSTSSSAKEFVKNLSSRLRDLINSNSGDIAFEGIGISVPGRVDSITGNLVFAPNLGWRNLDIRSAVEGSVKLPVEIENAANACALAENYFGQHTDGIDNLIVVTVSEGIGTGIIVNGQLMRGSSGNAGEFGHVSLIPDGPQCSCGNRGCWEVFASNTAALRYYSQSAKAAGKGRAEEVTSFEDLLKRSENGDSHAQIAIEKMAEYLGLGMAMLITGFQPNLVIVVGEVTRVWGRVGKIISNVVSARCNTPDLETRILPADDALQPRLRGTIALVLEKHFGAPPVA
jgi:predicted NBD/HSP70 family sugar kinase